MKMNVDTIYLQVNGIKIQHIYLKYKYILKSEITCTYWVLDFYLNHIIKHIG